MISAISPSTALPPRSTRRSVDAAERRIRRQARRVVGAAALQRQDQVRRRRTTRAAGAASVLPQAPARSRLPLRGRAHRAAFALNRDDVRRLAVVPRRVGECCATTCSQPSAMTSTAPTLGCPQYAGERVVGDAHVGAELAAAGEVRQRGAERRRRRGDPLGDDRRADDRRHDEHVIARADAAVAAAIAVEPWTCSHRCAGAVCGTSGGSAGRASGSAGRKRQVAAAAAARDVVRVHVRAGRDVPAGGADRAAVLEDASPLGDRAERDLVSGGIGSRTATDTPFAGRRRARPRALRARWRRCRGR